MEHQNINGAKGWMNREAIKAVHSLPSGHMDLGCIQTDTMDLKLDGYQKGKERELMMETNPRADNASMALEFMGLTGD